MSNFLMKLLESCQTFGDCVEPPFSQEEIRVFLRSTDLDRVTSGLQHLKDLDNLAVIAYWDSFTDKPCMMRYYRLPPDDTVKNIFCIGHRVSIDDAARLAQSYDSLPAHAYAVSLPVSPTAGPCDYLARILCAANDIPFDKAYPLISCFSEPFRRFFWAAALAGFVEGTLFLNNGKEQDIEYFVIARKNNCHPDILADAESLK